MERSFVTERRRAIAAERLSRFVSLAATLGLENLIVHATDSDVFDVVSTAPGGGVSDGPRCKVALATIDGVSIAVTMGRGL
jgi:hypothetical protein